MPISTAVSTSIWTDHRSRRRLHRLRGGPPRAAGVLRSHEVHRLDMDPMRVLVTGMGGQLGTLVARRLERRDDVETVMGIDLDPPRRRMHRAEFHWTRPGDSETVAEVVRELDPTVVLHLGQYEPHARLVPDRADRSSRHATESLIAALDHGRSLQAVVIRSGIEVYGRGRVAPTCPDEAVPPEPTSAFGRRLFLTEEAVTEFAEPRGVRVCALRFAPIAGYHAPNPLSRLLKLHAVPVPVLSEPTFSLVHAHDAADAVVAAAHGDVAEPVNVVADGVVSAYQAVRMGGRVPVPVLGPGWTVAGRLAELIGSPLPDHVREALARGRSADGARCAELLGVMPTRSTRDIVAEIYQQNPVEFLEVIDGYAA